MKFSARLRRPPRPHQPVAQDVLLADHGGVGGLEAGFEAQHRERDLRLRQRQRLRPGADAGDRLGRPCSASTWLHALARALAPERDDDALAGRLQRLHVPGHGIEHAGGVLGALGREIVALPRADIDAGAGLVRHRKRRQPRQRRGLQPLGPFALRQIEPVRRQRLVGRPAFVGERVLARLVIVVDLRQPLARRVLGQIFEDHRRAGHVVEQRIEPVVEQRQPVLHAGMAAAFADRLVQQIVGVGRAEGRDIAGAEFADRVGGELEFGDRHEVERAHLHHGALRLRIEAADRLDARRRRNRAAPADPCRAANRSRMPPRTAYSPGSRTVETREKPLSSSQRITPVHAEHVAGRGRQRLFADQIPAPARAAARR